MAEPLVVGVDEAARLLGISRSKCYGLIKGNRLPHVRVGHSLRVPLEPLRRLIERDTAEAEPEQQLAAR